MSRQTYDSDVWAAPPPRDGEDTAEAEAQPQSLFLQHFQDRMVVVGKDGANAQLPAAPATRTVIIRVDTAPTIMSGGGAGKKLPRVILSPQELRAKQQQQQQRQQENHSQWPRAVSTPEVDQRQHKQRQHLVEEEGPWAEVNALGYGRSVAPPELNVTALQAQVPPRQAPRRPSSGQRLSPVWHSRRPPSPGDSDGQPVVNCPRPPPRRASDEAAPAHPVYRHTGIYARKPPAPAEHGGDDSSTDEDNAACHRGAASGGTPHMGLPAGERSPVRYERMEHLVEYAHTPPRWRKRRSGSVEAKPRGPSAGSSPKATRPKPKSKAAKATGKGNAPRKQSEARGRPKPAAPPPHRAKVEYTPATVSSYKALMEKYTANKAARSLGPADTEEQRQAKERIERSRAYGAMAQRTALEALAALALPPPPTEVVSPTSGRFRHSDACTPKLEEQERLANEAEGSERDRTRVKEEEQQQKKSRALAGLRAPQASTTTDGTRAVAACELDFDRVVNGSGDRAKGTATPLSLQAPVGPAPDGTTAAAVPAQPAAVPKKIRQPPSKELLEARRRRRRAQRYGQAVERKTIDEFRDQQEQQQRQLAGDTDSGDDALPSPGTLTAEEAAAAERRQRLVDLEARHAQGKESTEAIRKQWVPRS